jgi:CheY-like chemotaxis protein
VLIKPITESVMFNTILDILSPLSSEQTRKSAEIFATRRGQPARDAVYARLTGKRILVVDDNAFNREVAGDFLLAAGVEVDTAIDGIDALDKLKSSDFDAVLMDMHMPRMDGLAAVREIRQQDRWSRLPVIALTAQARIEDQNASLQAGMSAHLTKPIDERLLYRTLIDVLGLAPDRGDGPEETGGRAADKKANDIRRDFSLSTALDRLGGHTGRVERLLKGFLRDFADAPQRLDRHLRMHDTDGIAALAHAMKGSAGYFCAPDFCAVADRLERAARDGDAAGIEVHSQGFCVRMQHLLGDIGGGLDALREMDERAGSRVDLDAVLAIVARAAPLLERGDYAASSLLEQIRAGLQGHADQDLVNDVQMHFDELELEAAGAALVRLRTRLEVACGGAGS